mmetsp:Transcript_43848/g.82241  ORF Transcript_43848/g.82241 Transcript_43848/m.82241 type:complete len:449 (+) Transcript_43848:61-1407(+)
MEITSPTSGPEFFIETPHDGPSRWRPHQESLRVGMLVHVTDDLVLFERECKAASLSWPNDDAIDDDDIPRATTQLGKSGRVLEVDMDEKLALLGNAVGYVPLAALKEFGGQASPWLSHLEQHGYVVLKKIATSEEVALARQMIWDTFEERFDVLRDDVSTWTKLGGGSGPGIFTGWGLAQSQGPWFIRSLERAKEAFTQIWGTNDLIASMDALMVWKPWWAYPEKLPTWANPWYPQTEGLHLDQNPYRKPNLDCIQGMMPLYDVTETVGGLEVVPGSHRPDAKKELKKFFTRFSSNPWGGEDFCAFEEYCDKSAHVPLNTPGQLLVAEAGDLILWDSRTVHGGVVGNGSPEVAESSSPRLARLTVNFCMTPKSWASDEDLAFRKQCFEIGRCLNHCPHKPNRTMHAGLSALAWPPGFVPDEKQRRLIPFDMPHACEQTRSAHKRCDIM